MVKSTLKNGTNFLFNTQNTIISAAFILAFATGLNAVLGLVKNRLLTHYFGVSDQLGVFYTADRIPSLIYSTLVVGALSTVFIPVFNGHYKKSPSTAWHTASSMITATLIFFLILGGIIFAGAPLVMEILSVGKFTPDQVTLGANLMRIMLVGQFILIFSSFLTSLLQSFKYFIIPALAPILYSFGMILGTILLSDRYGIYGPAIGVIIGAFFHMFIQIPLLKKIGYKYTLSLDFRDKGLREIYKLVPPRITSVILANTIATVNNSFAILVSTSSVIFLKFANQLQFFPVSLFGLSISAAALPTFSLESGDDDHEKFKKTFITSLHQMLFLVMPASVILFVLRVPVVRLVYGSANFPWEATLQTAYALGFFSISIFAQSAIYLLNRAFFAFRDTTTPVKISLVTICINIGLSLFFVNYLKWGVWSLAFSYSITSFMDTIVLLYFLSKKLGGFDLEKLLGPFTKISYASVFMGISLYLPLKLLDITVFDTSRTINLILLTGIACVAGGFSYLFFTKVFKVEEVQLLYKLLGKLQLRTKPVLPAEAEKNEV
ncbi:MAG TPA: murein biosynthesis integral membrane protein MurJ [Candidatus Saccharimonadales bacterium]|nr:murein biosynthesis integral membrane protein MurJ [Candidatus Saccharimonadales bacterium]